MIDLTPLPNNPGRHICQIVAEHCELLCMSRYTALAPTLVERLERVAALEVQASALMVALNQLSPKSAAEAQFLEEVREHTDMLVTWWLYLGPRDIDPPRSVTGRQTSIEEAAAKLMAAACL